MHNSSSKMDSQIIYSIFQHFNFEMGNLTLKLSYTSDLAPHNIPQLTFMQVLYISLLAIK